MTKKENILEELKEIQSDLGIVEFPGYHVPQGYFEGLPGEILRRIKALESTGVKEELENLSPLLSAVSKKTPFSVPDGYFHDLASQVVSGNAGELPEAISPMLASLKNKTTYWVPAGYFENLAATALEKVSKTETKLIPITSRNWFRYAAAATVIAFVAMIVFLFPGRNLADPQTTSYSWVKNNLKKVSTDDINEFVELATVEATDVAKSDTRDEISSLLKDVSDKEIQEFLNETQFADITSDEELILN